MLTFSELVHCFWLGSASVALASAVGSRLCPRLVNPVTRYGRLRDKEAGVSNTIAV